MLGLTGSSILWNFQGRDLGLPSTVLSLLILAVGVFLLRPTSVETAIQNSENTFNADKKEIPNTDKQNQPESVKVTSSQSYGSGKNIRDESVSQKQVSMTIAEAIAKELAEEDSAKPDMRIVNFAPEAFRPGKAIRSNKRKPGNNLSGFKEMAAEMFRSS